MPQPALIPFEPPPERLPDRVAGLPGMVARLVQSGALPEIVDGRNYTAALRDLVRRAKLGLEAQNACAEARLRLERRLGQMLRAAGIRKGRSPTKNVPAQNNFDKPRIKLADLGIKDRKLSARAQQLADYPEGRFNRFFVYACRFEWEITNDLIIDRLDLDSLNEVVRQRAELAERLRHRPQRRARAEIPAPEITPTTRLIHGDCLRVMPAEIPDHSVHLILTDLPRGSGARLSWDKPLDLDALFEQYWRVLVPYGVIVLPASQPYASELIVHQRENFKYEIVWLKGTHADFVHAKHRPLRVHENIVVLSRGTMSRRGTRHPMPYFPDIHHEDGLPKSVIQFPADRPLVHPMQKPLALMRWLVELYSLPGQLVLDSCMGSGTSGVAARQTGRHFIGIEKERRHFDKARRRIK